MNRAFKIAGFTVAGLAAAAGLSLVAARLLHNCRGWQLLDLQHEDLAAADTRERIPTSAEYALITLVLGYGWPINNCGERFGIDAGEPYLLVPLGSCEARLQFVPGDGNNFRLVSWGDTPVTGALAEPNPTYEAAVEEFVGG